MERRCRVSGLRNSLVLLQSNEERLKPKPQNAEQANAEVPLAGK